MHIPMNISPPQPIREAVMTAQEFLRISGLVYHPGYKRWRYLVADRLGCSYQEVYRWSNACQPIPEPIAVEVRNWERHYEETKARLRRNSHDSQDRPGDTNL